jgi:tetratricopeptide (TPR) repeat protein
MINAGRYADAESAARRLAISHQHSGLVWKVLSAALAMQGKVALPALERAAHLLPDDAEAQSNLGNALRALGRFDEAAACHRRAITISPDYAEAHNNLGSALRDIGNLNEAAICYRRALQLKPDLAVATSNLGKLLHDLGQPEEAAASYRRALAVNPNMPELHDRLGNELRELRQLDAAVASYRRAVAIKPDFAAAHNNLGNALRDLGHIDEALMSYWRAVEINPGHAGFHNNLGNAQLDLGHPSDAVGSYRRALELKPDVATTLSNLGSALRDLGQLDASEVSYRRALALSPESAEIYNNLAIVLRLQNRAAEAEASCRRALAINPCLPPAIALLGRMHADKGQFSEAEDLFKQAISIEPEFPEAWSGIANLRRMSATDAAWLNGIQRIVAKGVPARQEAHLRYAIGKYFDDMKDYSMAFVNYQRANELTKMHGSKHDREQLTATVDSLIRSFGTDWLTYARNNGIASPRPVFIVGMPRSGTTLAEQILASHSGVFGANELTFWSVASATYDASVMFGEHAGSIIHGLASDYLKLLSGLSAHAPRVVDKMPANFMSLGLISAALPSARIIHMRRNPLDTCLSIYFQEFNATYSFANDLEDIAHYYAEYLRVMKHWRSALPDGVILDVPYEQLVRDQEAWSRRMVEFIGLAWEPNCMQFHQTDRNVSTLSNWQVRQRISNSSVGRWRNYESFIGSLLHLDKLQP